MQEEVLEYWSRIDAVFMGTLEQATEEREAFLEQACAGDPALRQHVEQLLAAHEAVGDFLAEPLLAGLDVEDLAGGAAVEGRRMGPYRLLREIGRGGMGAVYLAERADGQFHQQVALKLIRGGLESREALRRFRLERQILARLQHPNVARLLDGGVTEEGQPYFVMEYVEGMPITTYCDRHRLGIEQRLELFRTVCRAVEYAHRNLVVHRDLKPTNMLVTEEGQVKLLDFGIAKLLNPEAYGFSVTRTDTSNRMLTPGYASPEQVRGEPITTASDVYQLGILLYELLAGQHPHRLPGRMLLHEVERIICEEEPGKPSTAVARIEEVEGPARGPVQVTAAAVSRARGVPVAKLRRRLRGDLDTICLKALKKEPEWRYGSVEQLSEDIRRHLAGEPVLVRKDMLRYRASKFVRRHRVGVGAAVLVMVSLVGGIAATSIQAQMARQEAVKAQHIAAFLEQMLSSVGDLNQGRDVRVEQIMDVAVRRANADLANQPEVAAVVHHIIGQTYHGLGLYERAAVHHQQALGIRKALFGEEHPDVAESLHGLAYARHEQSDYTAAEPLFWQVLAIQQKLYGKEHPEVAKTLENLGFTLQEKGDYTAAEPLYRQALAIRRNYWGEDHVDVAVSLHSLARLLHEKGDLAGAEPLYQQSLVLRRKLYGEEHPEVARTISALAGLQQQRGDYAAAESLYHHGLDIYRKTVPEGHPRTASAIIGFGLVLCERGDFQRAETMLREAVSIRRASFPVGNWKTAEAESALGSCLTTQGRFEEAEPLLVQSYAVLEAKRSQAKPTRRALDRVVTLYEAWGRPEKAAAYQKASSRPEPKEAGTRGEIGSQ